MATDIKARRLTEENLRLAAELAEAQEVLRALRSGEVDALVGSGHDAIYAVQLIALAIDRAETYLESITLLLNRLCHVTGWDYGEVWTVEGGRVTERIPTWYGVNPEAARVRESLAEVAANAAAETVHHTLRNAEPRWIGIEDLQAGSYAEALRRQGISTGLVLPLVIADRVGAVFVLWRKERETTNVFVLQHARQILEEAAPFLQRKREGENRQHALETMRGMVHERSRRLAELSGQLQEQSARREQAEISSLSHQEASFRSKRVVDQQGALLQSILDSMADGVIVTDPSGRILQCNPAAREILGDVADVSLAEWPAKYGLHRPGTVTLLTADQLPLASAVRGESVDRVEMFVQNAMRPVGRTIAMSARPLRESDRSIYGAVAVFQDVTQRKREEARRLQRLVDQRDLLVREVHHRIKNNLAGVVALLHQHTSAHPEMKEIHAKLESQLYTVASMHGLEAIGKGGITLYDLIRTLSENSQSVFETQMKVDYGDNVEGLRKLKLRESESVPLALALNELLVNARKHGSSAMVALSALRDGKGVILEITNQVDPGAHLPDLETAVEKGRGLSLVLSLLPQDSASLEFERSGTRVSAIVRLPGEVFGASS